MSVDGALAELIEAPSASARRAVLRQHPELATLASVEAAKRAVEVRLRRSAVEARRAAAAVKLLAETEGSAAAAGRALLARAFVLHGTGRFAEACDAYRDAERALRSARDREAADRVLLPLVDALAHAGEEVVARRTAARARRAYRRIGADRWTVLLDMNLGNVHHRAGRLREALGAYERAAVGLDRLAARAGTAANDLNRANVLSLVGRHDEATRLYRGSAAFFRERGQAAAAARAEYNAAVLVSLQGDFSRALAALADVETAFAAERDARHLALVRLDRAEILLRLGQPDAAAEDASRARRGFRRLGLRPEAALAGGLCALARADDGPSSRRAVGHASRELTDAGWTAWGGALALHEAGLAIRAGDPDAAAEIVRRARPALRRAGLPDRLALASWLGARADEMRGRRGRARRGYLRVLEILAGLPLPWITWRAHHGLARLARDAGDRRAASRRFAAAERDVEIVRDSLAGDEVRGGLLEEAVPLYEDHVLFLLEGRGPHRTERAFELLERARARTLLAGLEGIPPAERSEDHPRAAAIRRELRELRARVSSALHDPGEDRRTRPPALRRNELVRAERRARALQIRLEGLVGPGALPERPVTPGVDQIRGCLGSDETLIAYAGLGGRLVAFRVSRDGLDGPHDLGDLWAVERTVGDLRHDLTRPSASAGLRTAACASAERRLRMLRRLLLEPLEQDLRGETLLVAPWGCLHGVPFPALLGDDGPLVAERRVVRIPSAGALWLARGRPRTRGRRVLVLGVPDERAPRVQEECDALGRTLSSARVACGAGATAERLGREGSGARAIHIATHGLFRTESPRLAAFLLADGWFGLPDVYGLRLRAELVVLSSCDGGLGGALRGGESLGLARAFLLAGARSLLSAIGPVRDDAAASFTAAFYEHLAAGQTAAEAHRRAVLAARNIYDHPALWGLFVLDGDGTARLRGASS